MLVGFLSYLITLLFIFLMCVLYGCYKVVNRYLESRSFFMPDKENFTAQPTFEQPIDDYNESVADEGEDELYTMPEEFINPELVEKNRLYDEKIARMKEELASVKQTGVLFNEDHAEVDMRYIPKPTHEYTDQG